jgi:hypothetical protein
MPINEASATATSITRCNSFRTELCEDSCWHAANKFFATDYINTDIHHETQSYCFLVTCNPNRDILAVT